MATLGILQRNPLLAAGAEGATAREGRPCWALAMPCATHSSTQPHSVISDKGHASPVPHSQQHSDPFSIE